MILTKYEHACFTVEADGKLLVVDPGELTTDLEAPQNVVAIVVTHEHADHFDVNALGALIANNPNAIIYANENITRQFGDKDETLPYKTVKAGEKVTAGQFTLEFFGGKHAEIHPNIPLITNLGVMINGTVFYPGDSFVEPNQPVKVLALPVTAPWLKISDSINYVRSVKPSLAYPTHDAIASYAGKQIADNMLKNFCEQVGINYQRLQEPLIIE